MSNNPHKGTDFIDSLKEEGVYKEVHARMMKEYGHLMKQKELGLWGKIMSRLRSIIGLILP